MASGVILVVSLLLVGGGGYGIWWGVKRREPYELITETPTTEIGSLSDTGIVELKGTVAESGETETFTSPIGQREGVLSAWKVEEWDERGDHSRWKTVATGVWSEPFVLDDGTGEVVVEVGDHADSRGLFSGVTNMKSSDGVSFGDVMVEVDDLYLQEEVGAESPAPGHISDFVTLESAVDRQSGSVTNVIDIGNAHGDRRYYERTFAPGDELYVLGRSYPRNPDPAYPLRPEEMVVTAPEGDEDGMLIVSNEREQDLVRQTRYHVLGLVGGGIAVAAGLFLLGRI